MLKQNDVIESAQELDSSDFAYQSRQEGGTLASLLTEAPTPLLLLPSLMRILRLSLLTGEKCIALDQTINFIREERSFLEKKERFDSRRIPFFFAFTS